MAAAPNLCVAANAAERVQKGTAECEASGTGSVAIANGEESLAEATGGNHNRARVRADGSFASATDGDNNTATVTGDFSAAQAFNGDGNTAIAGDNCTAIATGGDGLTDTCPP